MKKDYKFDEEKGCYEYCDGKECELNDMLKDGDAPHKKCSGCIEEFEGEAPDNSELSSTPKLRMERKKNA